MQVLICGRGNRKAYFGKVDSKEEKESLERALKELGDTIDSYSIKDVSNGTVESLEKGEIFADEIWEQS